MNYDAEYQRMFNELDATPAASAERAEIVRRMLAHAAAARVHYSARDGQEYRTAMWARREKIHAKGSTWAIWDGTDPITSERVATNEQAFGGHRFEKKTPEDMVPDKSGVRPRVRAIMEKVAADHEVGLRYLAESGLDGPSV